uniref:BZIP domain-containing protein n=1 Tax=Opuntia streptacantha TaxID=393608 RepID=A0A7C8Z845_OPUST
MDERKRKRMLSNRESARRSRMRKQKHLDDLMAQVADLRRENEQILQTISVTTQQLINVDAENSVLRAQMSELAQRLESLNEIVNYMNTFSGVGSLEEDCLGFVGNGMGDFGVLEGYNGNLLNVGGHNPWGLGFLNQPIIASDVLQY